MVLDLVQAHEKKDLPLEEIILVGLAFPSSDQLLSWLALHSMVGSGGPCRIVMRKRHGCYVQTDQHSKSYSPKAGTCIANVQPQHK